MAFSPGLFPHQQVVSGLFQVCLRRKDCVFYKKIHKLQKVGFIYHIFKFRLYFRLKREKDPVFFSGWPRNRFQIICYSRKLWIYFRLFLVSFCLSHHLKPCSMRWGYFVKLTMKIRRGHIYADAMHKHRYVKYF